MGIPDHRTCLLRNLYAGQEATVRTGHGTTDAFQIGKGVCQGCILSSCLFNFMQSTSREMLGWMKHKLESRLRGEISITTDMQMTPYAAAAAAKSLQSCPTFICIYLIYADIICISEVIDISPSNLDSSLCFIQPSS